MRIISGKEMGAKAYQHKLGDPFIGDMRHNHPPETPLNKIFDFEIWTGDKWEHAQILKDRVWQVQES